MTVQQLKERVEAYREELRAKGSKVVMSSEGGPIGIGPIEAIVTVLEGQEKRITELKAELNLIPRR